jgi:molecular chaperone HtpG
MTMKETKHDTDLRIEELTLVKLLKDKQSPFFDNVMKVYNEVKEILNNRIPVIFSNYTLHNVGHSLRIINYMGKIVEDPKLLNDLEITLLILSALLHDVGMAVSDDTIKRIKTGHYTYNGMKYSAMKRVVKTDNLALEEYVRRAHAHLSAEYILTHHQAEFLVTGSPTLSFAKELAEICESHTQPYDYIRKNLRQEVRGKFRFNSQYIACVLRIADILDIDSNRTPYNLYRIIDLGQRSKEEWKQHFLITNDEKIELNTRTGQKQVAFYGRSKNPKIHRKLLSYIGWVQQELSQAVALTASFGSPHTLNYDEKPIVHIQAEGYTFSDYKMTLDFKAVTALLMGEKIYGSRTLGLRELIQNCIDACKIRQERENDSKKLGQETFIPKVKVIINAEADTVVIKDNGIGMTIDTIKRHFLNIGVSYYSSDEFHLNDFTYKPIGNFGIGFLSCFMLSNTVTVNTRYYSSPIKFTINLEKDSEYTSLTETEDITFEGTEVILKYSDFKDVFKKSSDVHKFIKDYFLTDAVTIEVYDSAAKNNDKKIIENPLRNFSRPAQGLIAIDLSLYLRNVEGYALIKPKTQFIKSFQDLSFEGSLYLYENRQLKQIDDRSSLALDDFVVEDELKYMSLPLITSDIETDFKNGLKFMDGDVEEVIKKLDRDLTWISIICKKDLVDELDQRRFSWNDDILPGVAFEFLEKLGHESDYETQSFRKHVKLFEGKKNELYMPFDKTNTPNFWPYLHLFNSETRTLFVRGVFIKDFHYSIPIISSIFELTEIRLNLTSRQVIPDISRNNLDQLTADKVCYALTKAIHKAAMELLNISKDEKETLGRFIKTHFASVSDLDKDEFSEDEKH